MEQLKDLGKDRTGVGVVCFLITRTVLIFVDISCVGASFGLILCILYLTFLKDCLEILIYAVAKLSTRLKWLYRVFKIQDLLYIKANELENREAYELENTEANKLESNTQKNLNDSILPKNSCLEKNSLDLPESSSFNSGSQYNSCLKKDKLDFVGSSSFNSRSQYNPLNFSCSQSKNTSEFGEGNESSVIFESPRSSKSGLQEPVPRKLSSLSTQIVSSTENITIDETKFEDIDLSNQTNEVGSRISREELNSKSSSSKWNISKIKVLDQFRRNKLLSPVSVKSHIGNIAAKVTGILPEQADKDKLIGDKGSPEQVACCSYLPQFFKPKYQTSSAVPYKQF